MKLQLKYGWAPVCWFLLEALAAHEFTAAERRVIDVVLRMTYGKKDIDRPGFQMERAEISRRDFMKRTGLSKTTLKRALSSLIENKVIILHSDACGTISKCYGMNTRFSTWTVKKTGEILEKKFPGTEELGGPPTDPLEDDARGSTHGPGGGPPTDPLEGPPTDPTQVVDDSQKTAPLQAEEDVEFSSYRKIERSIERSPLPPKGGNDDDFFDQNLPLGSNQVSTIDDVRGLPKDLTFIASFAQADGFLRKFWSAACLSYIETESLKAYYAHNRDQYNPKQLLGNILLAAQEESDRRASTPPDQHRYLGKPIAKTIAAAGPRLLAKRKAATEPQRPQAEDWSRKDRDRPERRKTA